MEPTAFLQKLSHKSVKYAIFQKESGETGTIHYQGYLELAANYRFTFVKNLIGDNAHLERRRGTAEQARSYCSKTESRLDGPYEYGIFTHKQPGRRSDLQDAITDLAEHRSLNTLAINHGATFVRYNRGFSRYLQVTAKRRTQAPTISLYFGDTGTGKTRKVIEENPDYFRKHPDNKWFDGYNEHDVLLLDDFGGASSKMSLNYVLQLLDRYPFTIEIKGNFVELLATKIFITTNSHPNQWYDYSKRLTQYKALARRIHHVWVFDADGAFRVEHAKFFGDTPYQTPVDYRAIALKRPVLHRQNATIDLTCNEVIDDLICSDVLEDDFTLSGTEGNSSLYDSIDLAAMSEENSDDDDFEPTKKKRKIK